MATPKNVTVLQTRQLIGSFGFGVENWDFTCWKMTRTCRICGGADGRYWIETPVDKYSEKTFNQILLELTRLEVRTPINPHPIIQQMIRQT